MNLRLVATLFFAIFFLAGRASAQEGGDSGGGDASGGEPGYYTVDPGSYAPDPGGYGGGTVSPVTPQTPMPSPANIGLPQTNLALATPPPNVMDQINQARARAQAAQDQQSAMEAQEQLAAAWAAYMQWYNSQLDAFQGVFHQYFQALPQLNGQKNGNSLSVPSVQVFRSDQRDNNRLAQAGNALVITGFDPYPDVMNLIRKMGVPGRVGNVEIRDGDELEKFSTEERAHDDALVQFGMTDTESKMAAVSRQVDQLSRMTAEIQSAEIPSVTVDNQAASPGVPPEFQSRIERVEVKLNSFEPVSEQENALKGFAENSLEVSKGDLTSGDQADANWYLSRAETVANFLVGLDPVTGLVRSAYESITGKNFVTGEQLSGFERTLAVICLATLGTSTDAVEGLRLVEKLGISTQSAQRFVQKLVDARARIGSLLPSLTTFYEKTIGRIPALQESRMLRGIERAIFKPEAGEETVAVEDWEEMTTQYMERHPPKIVNGKQEFPSPPYHFGVYGFRVETTTDETFLRFSVNPKNLGDGRSGPVGSFIVREGDALAQDGRHLTAEELQRKFALPSEPNYVTDVKVTKGTALLKSRVGENFEMEGSGIQYELLEDLDPKSQFLNTRKLLEWINGK